MEQTTISITGMNCGGCVNSVRRALANVAGVIDANVKVGVAEVTYDPESTNPRALRDAIVQAGFAVAAA